MTKFCEICAEPYITKPSHATRRKYCSRACFEVAHSFAMLGSGNPAWAGARETCTDCKIDIGFKQPGSRCNPCYRKFNRGENHYNWQGGKTPENAKIRNSAEYRAWRKAVFERDKYTCQLCGQIGGGLHADHIEPFAIAIDLRFELSNGRTLCVECHKQTPTYLSGTR